MPVSFGQHLVDYLRLYMGQHKLTSLGQINGRLLHELADRAFADFMAKSKKAKKMAGDAEWLADLQADPANAGLDVAEQLKQAEFWCNQRSKVCTRRFFVNWLIKADRKAVSSPSAGLKSSNPYQEPTFDWRASAQRIYPDSRDWVNPHDFGLIAWHEIDLTMRKKILAKSA